MVSVTSSQYHRETIILSALPRNVSRLPSFRQSLSQPRINILPVELLGRIFIYAHYATKFSHPSGAQPIALSHVCASWRAIALSTSALWTTIEMTFPHVPSQMGRTKAFLSRSKRSKLDLHLDFRDPDWSWDDLGHRPHPFGFKDMMAIMAMLIPHIARWRSVDLLVDTWAPIYTFLSYCKVAQPAPALARVSLSRCNAYYAEAGQTFTPVSLRDPIKLFEHASTESLQELVLTGVHVDWSSACFHGLKTLEMSYLAMDVVPTIEQFVKILDSCPQLQSLTIMGRGPSIDSALPMTTPVPMNDWLKWQSRICLEHLQSFTLGFTDITYAVELLFLFQLPALKSLTLEDLETTLFLNDDNHSTALLDVLSSSSNSIKLSGIETLEFRGISANSSSLARFLRQCASVKILATTSCPELLIDALRPLELELDYPVLLPALSKVHIMKCLEDSQVTRDVFHAIFDRWIAQQGTSALKEIHIMDGWSKSPSDEDMALLLAAGVRLLTSAEA